MTLLSRKSDYALLILWHLHHRSGGASARELADRFGLSQAFVANILKELCQKEFVVSRRGVKGGYSLARSADSISLIEVLEALEEPFRLTECSPPHGDEGCTHEGLCPIKGPLALVHQRLRDVLARVSLTDLFGGPEVEVSPFVTSLPVLELETIRLAE